MRRGEALEELRRELDRVGMSYGAAGARDFVLVEEHGGGAIVLKGPPLTELRWRGTLTKALRVLGALENDAGPEVFWRALRPDLLHPGE